MSWATLLDSPSEVRALPRCRSKGFNLWEQQISLHEVLRQSVKKVVGTNSWTRFRTFKEQRQIVPFSITFWIARLRRYRRAFLGIKATLEREENIRDSGDHLPRLESHKRHQNVVIDDDAISYIPPRCLTFLVCSFHHYVREIHVEKSAVVV